MSLARIALRATAVEALKGRTRALKMFSTAKLALSIAIVRAKSKLKPGHTS